MKRATLLLSIVFSYFFFLNIPSVQSQAYGDGSVSTDQGPVKEAKVVVDGDNADQTVYTNDQGQFEFNGLYVGIDEVSAPDGIEVRASFGSVHGVSYPTPERDDGVGLLYGVNGQLVSEVPVDSHGGVTCPFFPYLSFY